MAKLMIACDVEDAVKLDELLTVFEGVTKPCLKIGMELFYKEGPALIQKLKAEGYEIFLDLKLHDIPMTVKKALQSLTTLGVDYVTIHAAGGKQMMQYAADAVAGTSIKLLAVTILTSLNQEQVTDELLLTGELQTISEKYAQHAYEVGIAGCICSAFEAARIKEVTANDFLCVTPGIRNSEDEVGDQARVATPKFAIEQGADGLVIGRMLTAAQNPRSVYEELLTV